MPTSYSPALGHASDVRHRHVVCILVGDPQDELEAWLGGDVVLLDAGTTRMRRPARCGVLASPPIRVLQTS
jgi:hypothetical protein